MCASAISEVHIDKLYFGAYDNKNGGIEKFKFQSKREIGRASCRERV